MVGWHHYHTPRVRRSSTGHRLPPGSDPRQYPAEQLYGHNAHRIVTGRWPSEGSIVDRHLVPLPYNNFVQ